MVGFVDMDPKVVAEIRTLFADPLATFAANDAEKLTDLLADLPAEARQGILHCIVLHQYLKRNREPDSGPIVDKIREAAASLLAYLESFDLDNLASEFLDIDSLSAQPRIDRDYPGHPFDKSRYRDRIDGMLADLRDLIFWLGVIYQQQSPPWQKTKDARKLVRWIADIIEEHQRPISRRDKEGSLTWLHKIIEIADPDVGKGTIDGVLKARSERRGEIRR
jgi:hypothetical protein